MKSFAVVVVTLALIVAPTADAQRLGRRAPHATPYSGLLPENVQLDPAPPLDVEHLRRSKVVLVPSSNFNDYARLWVEYYEGGGFERNWAVQLLNVQREQVAGQQQNSDPRAFADRFAEALRPHVGELAVAEDLPSAREQGGDYYLILDAWLSAPGQGSRFRVAGGAHLLDGSLRHVFSLEGAGEARRDGGLFSNQFEVDARAMTDSMTGFSDTVLSQLAQRVGPAAPS
ncbi:hypothetical protein U91I_00587 [alpha proteobacterium U9-1i]|nr:hypothetical protein U91I_00587 [alpha proteobacterium U9-1i]